MRIRRDVQELHRLGPRAVYEFLVELGRDCLIRTAIETKIERYTDRLSPELLRVTGGDRFPAEPIHLVDDGLRGWGRTVRGTPAARARPLRSSIDFRRINDAVLPSLLSLLKRWLPGGRLNGREYVVRNPRRADRQPGSFLINVRTGAWADFATGDKGGDPISLAAYLAGISQAEAAKRLAQMFSVETRHGQ